MAASTEGTVKIVVLGSGGVGKSSLTIRFIQDVFVDSYDPTIEDSYRHQIEVGGDPVILEILDTAGTEQFASMRDMYMKSGDGFLLTYSIVEPSTFVDVEELFENVVRVRDSDPSQIPMVLAGNKCDLAEKREVTVEQGEHLARKFGVPFFETSAKTRHNINEIFLNLTKQILKSSKPVKEKRRGLCNLL